MRLKDKSKRIKDKIVTSDEFLYEISTIKEELNKNILTNVKESAIDCMIHSRSTSKEEVKCFIFGNPDENQLMYTPNIKEQLTDKAMQLNKKTVGVKLHKLRNTNYAINKETNEVYDYDAYKKGQLLYIGKLKKEPSGKYSVDIEK